MDENAENSLRLTNKEAMTLWVLLARMGHDTICGERRGGYYDYLTEPDQVAVIAEVASKVNVATNFE